MTNVMQMGKKAFTWSVVVTTILWSMGVAALVPLVANAAEACPPLEAGDLFKVPGNSAVYLLNADMNRMYFPNSAVYQTWYPDFSGVVEIPNTCVDAYPAPASAPYGVNFRPGSALVKVQVSPSVYVVEEGNQLSKIGSEQVASDLYGSNWATKVYDIADVFWPNYTGRGAELTDATLHDGMLAKVAGSNDVYYVTGGEKFMLDGAVRNSAEVQVVSQSVLNSVPDGSGTKTAASLYSDPTQGAGGSGSGTGTGTGSGTGTGTSSAGTLTVALAADTPSGTNAVKSAARVPFTKLNFTATGGDVVIDRFVVERMGFGINGDFSKINAVDAAGNLLNEAGKTLNSSNQATFTEDIVVPSGQTVSYTLVADMASSVGGGNLPTLALVSLDTASTVVGNLPLEGNPVNINSSVTLGTVTVEEATSVGNSTEQVGEQNVLLASLRISVASEDFQIERLILNNSGTASDSDIQNLELLYNNNVIATGSLVDKYVNFDLSACGNDCKIDKGRNKTFEVRGDLVSGSSRTINLDVKRDSHLLAKDLNSNFYRLPTNSASSMTNTITISQGKLNVTKVNNVPAQDVPEDVTDIALASWNFHVTGEPIDISTLVFKITTTGTVAPQAFDALTLYDAGGSALTGGVDGVGASAASVGYASSTDTISLDPGDNILTLRGNIDNTPSANDTVQFAIDMSNTDNFEAIGLDSGETITLGTYATPNAVVSANTQTITTARLRVTTLTTPTAATYAPGTSDVVVARVQLDASGSSEDLKVTQFKVKDTTSATAKTIDFQNIRLWVDKDGDAFDGDNDLEQLNEVQNGSDSDAGDDETFTFNLSGSDQFVVKKGKKVIVEVRANIAGGATVGSHTFATNVADDVSANGVDTTSSVSEVIDSAAGQATSVGTSGGQVEISIATDNPTAALLAGGTQGVTLATFDFYATTTEDVEIESIKFTQRVTDTSSSSFQDYSQLYLEDENGNNLGSVTPTSTTPVIEPGDDVFVVDKDSGQPMKVYLKANLASLGPSQSDPISVGGHRVGFNIAAVGDVIAKGALTGVGSTEFFGSSVPNGNTHYVYRALPTVTPLAVGSTLTNGENVLYKFRVTANSGDVGVGKFTFDLTTTTATVTNVELYDVTNTQENRLYSMSMGTVANGYLEVPLNEDVEGDNTQAIKEVTVSNGTPRTFELRGTVTGVATGASVSTRMGGDSALADGSSSNGSPAQLANYLTASTTAIDAGLHDDFIWTDRHLGSHSVNTNDWTNGYLVSGLSSGSSTPSVVSK